MKNYVNLITSQNPSAKKANSIFVFFYLFAKDNHHHSFPAEKVCELHSHSHHVICAG